MGSGSLARLRIAFLLLGVALLAPLLFLVRAAEVRFETQRQLRHEMVAERIFDEMETELTALLERESQRPSSAYDVVHTRVESWAPFVVGYFKRDITGPHLLAQAQLSPTRASRTRDAITTLFEGAAAPLKEQWLHERALQRTRQPVQAEKEEYKALGRVQNSRTNLPGTHSTSESRKRSPARKSMRFKQRKHRPSRPNPSPAMDSLHSTDSLRSGAPAPTQENLSAQTAGSKQDTAQVLRQLNRAGKKRKSARRKRPPQAPSTSRPTSDDPLSGMEGL